MRGVSVIAANLRTVRGEAGDAHAGGALRGERGVRVCQRCERSLACNTPNARHECLKLGGGERGLLLGDQRAHRTRAYVEHSASWHGGRGLAGAMKERSRRGARDGTAPGGSCNWYVRDAGPGGPRSGTGGPRKRGPGDRGVLEAGPGGPRRGTGGSRNQGPGSPRQRVNITRNMVKQTRGGGGRRGSGGRNWGAATNIKTNQTRGGRQTDPGGR